MAKNIVICSDGTGNTFDRRVTNVTRLVRRLALDDPSRQVVIYDQGIGTAWRRNDKIGRLAGREAFVRLPAPRWNPLALLLGLGFGHGLRRNVGEMYCALAWLYDPGDRVFLFGFSRGAFTVRALAGLLHRCHLPEAVDPGHLESRFRRAWALYEIMRPSVRDRREIAALRREHRRCPIYFLGAWDSVKSYGGVNPIMLPHLRHNPDVGHVRHALALDEHRGWFKPTTWGQLDLDEKGAKARLHPLHSPAYASQDVCEAWFAGSHCDVGAGRIALRWMLGEAARLDPPLLLNNAGTMTLRLADRPLGVRESTSLGYRIADLLRFREIDNSGEWPALDEPLPGTRCPLQTPRRGKVVVHASARGRLDGPGVEYCETWSGGA